MPEDIKKEQITTDEIKDLWEKIDRRMKRATHDDEIAGEPDYLMADPDSIPLMMDTSDLNILGNLSARKIYDIFDKEEREKYLRIQRYKKLQHVMNNPEIEGALNIYADEATVEDEDGEIIHVMHPNKKAVEIVEDLFSRIDIFNKAWEIVWNMCGYGDEMYEVIPSQSGKRILQINWIPREHIERIEKNGILKGFKPSDVRDTDTAFRVRTHQYWKKEDDDGGLIYPFRIIHWRIPSNKYAPYGKSIIDSITASVDQLNLMIKAMLIARVTRAPERRIYNVDVGNLQGEKAIRYANEAVSHLKRKKTMRLVGSQADRKDIIKDVFGATEDIVLPKRTGSEGNSITTLDQIGVINIDDAEFIRDRIFPPIGIPRQYIYDDTFANANTNLSSKNVMFAKRIKRVQRYFLMGLYKLATIELKLQKFSNEEIEELTLLMNNPSNIDERERLETDTNLWTLITTIKGLNTEQVFFPDYLIYKNYLKLNDDEIVELMKLSQLQMAGQNIFNFMPPSERPEGAEDLASQQVTPPGEGEAGAEGEGAGAGAPTGIPPEVEAELGPTPGGEATPPAETPPTPEVANVMPVPGKEVYAEENYDEFELINLNEETPDEISIELQKQDKQLIKKIEGEKENKVDLLENALALKEKFIKKLEEEKLNYFEEIEARRREEELQKIINVGRKQKASLSFLENSGELKGIKDYLSNGKNNYND